MPAKVTVKEIEDRIEYELPIGSSVSKVIEFIDSLHIDNVRIVRSEYYQIPPDDSLERAPASILALTRGHVVATLINVERDDLAAYNVDIYFYFGQNRSMIYYTVKKHGTVP